MHTNIMHVIFLCIIMSTNNDPLIAESKITSTLLLELQSHQYNVITHLSMSEHDTIGQTLVFPGSLLPKRK